MSNLEDNNIIYIIKLIGKAHAWDNFRLYLINSKNETKDPAYYNIQSNSSEYDRNIFTSMKENIDYHCAILDYTDKQITCLYWATCTKCSNRDSIHCRLKYSSTNKSIIENFVYCLQLDLDKDFSENSYINTESSFALIKQMSIFEMDPYIQKPVIMNYKALDCDNGLSPLDQKNEYCCRKYNIKAEHNRAEFQRDYDRIIYSKAFRRMVDKAQIFSSTKGDHYRTRITHTLIVSQIADGICSELNLNCALAAAIALGHDLGHTPFGHQGEKTLHAILTGKEGYEVKNLSLKATDNTEKKDQFPYGGFKHNYQSVRVATNLESQYLEIDGLDLSSQTLNGMWMHTDKKQCLNISEFSDGFLSDEGDYAFTLEGQVVAVADEIAQRSHDIDDAFASKLICDTDLTRYLELKKFRDLKESIDDLYEKLKNLSKNNRLFSNKNEVICSQISSMIVKYFINDVCIQTKKNMNEYSVESFKKENHHITERLVWFSDAGESLCKYLDNIIRKKVISSHEVTLF